MARSNVADDTGVGADPGHVDLGEVANVLRATRDAVLERWPRPDRERPLGHIPELYDALVAYVERTAPRELDHGATLDDPAVNVAAEAHANDCFERGLSSASVLTDCRIMKQEIGRAPR